MLNSCNSDKLNCRVEFPLMGNSCSTSVFKTGGDGERRRFPHLTEVLDDRAVAVCHDHCRCPGLVSDQPCDAHPRSQLQDSSAVGRTNKLNLVGIFFVAGATRQRFRRTLLRRTACHRAGLVVKTLRPSTCARVYVCALTRRDHRSRQMITATHKRDGDSENTNTMPPPPPLQTSPPQQEQHCSLPEMGNLQSSHLPTFHSSRSAEGCPFRQRSSIPFRWQDR